jgi:3-isopropylmalate/(R)-2-methylmalate dehydratase large subunit
MTGAQFDRVVELKAEEILPQVTWGTSPGDGHADRRPRAGSRPREKTRSSAKAWSARCSTWA